MAPRTSPSERQRRLGAELRKLRTHAGLSGDEAGVLLDADRTRISHIEAGRADVPRNGLHSLLRAYGCPEGPLFDGLMAMAQDRGKGWWDDHRSVMGRAARDVAELESRSTRIRIHEPLFVPGLLQTPDYAHAVISAVEDDSELVAGYVKFRLARQRILSSMVAYHAVIHESALRVRVGDGKIMRKQLLRLIEVARWPNVTLQIFPFEAGPYAAFSRPFILFGSSTPELDTVYLEHPLDTVFLGDRDRIDEYDRMFERLSALALGPVDPESAPESHEGQDSLSLIQHIMYEL
ncbi:helix-turn-helix domain-containing protein [Streptomyces sp. RB6PN25]|uniref:Helix-turn-helix domain-containing protein n=1 Tax=Streptomyces humicola TaxID=2953240 RepID=A0ABT1PRR2_9ACTN|nr:helix-turn-helix transcriptional regulator [Streptomyces humicola]MCQ4080357.1 helix-turn-helix domain-containing protein [Streptomyces humicola]